MKVEYKATKNVTPFLIYDPSLDNAAKIKKVVDEYKERDIQIFDYYMFKDCLLVLISGEIGNMIDDLSPKIGGFCISEDHAKVIMDQNGRREYASLQKDLSPVF